MARQRDKPIGFKTVQLLKDQILGIGSYGKVCKAICDDLLCAAKLIHETLFAPTTQQLITPQREHMLPMRRFEQECEFLSTIMHLSIVCPTTPRAGRGGRTRGDLLDLTLNTRPRGRAIDTPFVSTERSIWHAF